MTPPAHTIGRYALHGALASGGMATVHVGRLVGEVGFSRTVAIKRLHPQFSRDPEFVAMFLDEARLAARIHHPNVVPTLDVVSEEGELFLVMEYVSGESLARLWKSLAARGQRIPPRIGGAILVGALHGLHAAHEARDERGAPLDVVHRDVSPQNIIVGADGVPRVLDFGVAKAAGRSHETREGQLKGKLAYMAPEQFRRERVTRLVDVYAASVVLWEALAGERLNAGDSEAAVVERVLFGAYRPLRAIVPELPEGIDAILASGLAREPKDRFETARDLAIAVEGCLGAASALEVAAWVGEIARPALEERARLLEAMEAAIGGARVEPKAPAPAVARAAPAPRASMTETLTAAADEPAPSVDASPSATSGPSRRRVLGGVSVGLVAVGIAGALAARRPSTGAAPVAIEAAAGHSTTEPPDAAQTPALASALPEPPAPPAPMAPPLPAASSPEGPSPGASVAQKHPKPAAPHPAKSGKGPLPRGLPSDRD